MRLRSILPEVVLDVRCIWTPHCGHYMGTVRNRLCSTAVQALEYDYEMFATEEGRSVFAAADLDGDGRIDMAGFSKIVHVRPHPYRALSPSKAQYYTTCDMHMHMHMARTCLPRDTRLAHALACLPRSPHSGLNTSHLAMRT